MAKLRTPSERDKQNAKDWLEQAGIWLERNEYHRVKKLCGQVVRALQRKEHEGEKSNKSKKSTTLILQDEATTRERRIESPVGLPHVGNLLRVALSEEVFMYLYRVTEVEYQYDKNDNLLVIAYLVLERE